MPIDYPINDADNHYYETDDCFSRHIEARWAGETVRVDRKQEGVPATVYIGRERCLFFSKSPGDAVGPPGLLREFFRGQTERPMGPNADPIDGAAIDAYTRREARLALMNEQGVERCIILPTLGVGVEPQLRLPHHREALYPVVRAFNRWLEEDWGYGGDGRIFGVPLISLADIDEAVKEVTRLAAAGARFVLLPCGPSDGETPSHPQYDSFWAACEDARLSVVFHLGSNNLQPAYNSAWGLRPIPPSHRNSLMEHFLTYGDRAVVDTIAALLADNLFGRFPRLQVVSIEYGSGWVGPLLKRLDKIAKMNSKDLWRFGEAPELPSLMFALHARVAPYYEDDVPGLARLIGISRVLAGSDFPHPEGLANPVEFADSLTGLDDADVRKIMRDNFEERGIL